MYAPGIMYLGRAGPSKMIELAPLSLSLVRGAGDGGEEDGEGVNTAGRIGPSKMSTHSLTLSLPGEPGVEGVLIGEGGGGGIALVEVIGNIWACLEMEDEWVLRTNAEELRRIGGESGDGAWSGTWMSLLVKEQRAKWSESGGGLSLYIASLGRVGSFTVTSYGSGASSLPQSAVRVPGVCGASSTSIPSLTLSRCGGCAGRLAPLDPSVTR